MALVTVQQRLAPSVPDGVELPANFYAISKREMIALLGNAEEKFTKYVDAFASLEEQAPDGLKQGMLARLRNNMSEGQHYHKRPGASLQNGRGIVLTVAGKNQFLSAGVCDGDAWQQVHRDFRDWMLQNHLQILNAFTNAVPDQQYITNRANNVVQFNQNVQNIAENNPRQVARRGDKELLKAMTHPDELNIKRRNDGSIKSAGLAGGQASRVVRAVGGDPNDQDMVRRVQQKGTISAQLTAPAQSSQNFLRAMAVVQNALNPGDYKGCVRRVRDQFIESGALLHRDPDNNVRPAQEQGLIMYNPTYLASGGARRNGPELLTTALTAAALPALPAPALPAPAAALPALPAPALPAPVLPVH